MLNKRSCNKQKGVVLIFMALVIAFVILPMTAMVINVGRLIITLRQAQNLADVTASTGAQYLGKRCVANQTLDCGDVNNWASLEGWQSVKPAVRSLAQTLSINGAKSFSATDYFNYGINESVQDLANFQRQEIFATSGSGFNADVTMQVQRVSSCFDGTNWQKYQLDNIPNSYCLANAVEVTITISNYNLFLGQFLGVGTLNPKVRSTTAHLRWIPNACGQPSCTLIEAALASAQPCS
jgi:hypothetical protein